MKYLSAIKRFTLLVAVLAIAGVTSCQKEEAPIGKIPNAVEIICKSGDRPSFSFAVEGNWQLSSDQVWCKFMTSAGEMLDMAGKAGHHTISLKITDENIKNSPTFANITMKMGSHKGIIATVERGAKDLYMRIYDITDTPIDAISIGYVDYIPVRIEANFRFQLTDQPDWVEFLGGSVTGVPSEQTEALVRIIPDGEREQFKIEKEDGYTVTFTEIDGDHEFSFPIVYSGMDDYQLTYTGPTKANYSWEVSLDGKTFRQMDEATGEYVTFEEALPFNITAKDGNYTMLYFDKVIDRGIPTYYPREEGDNDVWMAFDRTSEKLSVESTDKMRYGMVMALPNGTFNKIRASIKEAIFELDASSGIGIETVRLDYEKYVIVDFTQCDFTERGAYEGMYAYHSLTTFEIPCEPYADAALTAEYGVEEVFTCPFPLPYDGKVPGLVIDPRIEGWNTDTFSEGVATAEFYYQGERLKSSDKEFEMGENKDEVMAATLYGPKAGFVENVYIVFKVDGVAKKLLVVTPPTE